MFHKIEPLYASKSFIYLLSVAEVTSWNPRWRLPGNLKGQIGDNQILFCQCFLNEIWNLIVFSSILTLIYFKSGGFLQQVTYFCPLSPLMPQLFSRLLQGCLQFLFNTTLICTSHVMPTLMRFQVLHLILSKTDKGLMSTLAFSCVQRRGLESRYKVMRFRACSAGSWKAVTKWCVFVPRLFPDVFLLSYILILILTHFLLI